MSRRVKDTGNLCARTPAAGETGRSRRARRCRRRTPLQPCIKGHRPETGCRSSPLIRQCETRDPQRIPQLQRVVAQLVPATALPDRAGMRQFVFRERLGVEGRPRPAGISSSTAAGLPQRLHWKWDSRVRLQFKSAPYALRRIPQNRRPMNSPLGRVRGSCAA